MNPFDLKDKVALVTGGNGGIGLGIAKGLAQAGAKVAIAGRNDAKNQAALKELGGGAIALKADVNDEAAVRRMVGETVKAFGGLDILVANAGINIRKLPQDYAAAEWHQIVDTNLTSVFQCCQAVYPEMKKRAADIGLIPIESPSVAGINDYIKSERVKWGALVDKIGLRGTQ